MDCSKIYSFLRQVSTNINIIFHCLVYFLMKKMKNLFQKDKASRYRKFLFEKKIFLILIKSVKTTSNQGGVRPPPAVPGCPSVLLSNKETLLLKQIALFQDQFDSILYFK